VELVTAPELSVTVPSSSPTPAPQRWIYLEANEASASEP